MERVKTLEQLAAEAAVLSAAAEQLRIAREEVERIQGIDRDVRAAERNVKDLAVKMAEAEEALKTAQSRLDDLRVALEAAEKAATAGGSDSSTRDTVARQALELRRVAAEQAGSGGAASDRCGAGGPESWWTSPRVRRVSIRSRRLKQKPLAPHLAMPLPRSKMRASSFDGWISWNGPSRHALLKNRLPLPGRALNRRRCFALVESETRERDGLAARRAAITIPLAASLGPMRRLANDLAGARGALNVGFVVTVTLQRPMDLRIQKDGTAPESTATAEPMEIEANAEVDIGIGDVAQVRIRGGRREAQEIVRDLERRWSDEVAPHLAASGVEDLDGLAAKVEDGQALDAAVKVKDTGAGVLARAARLPRRLRREAVGGIGAARDVPGGARWCFARLAGVRNRCTGKRSDNGVARAQAEIDRDAWTPHVPPRQRPRRTSRWLRSDVARHKLHWRRPSSREMPNWRGSRRA